MLRRSVAILVIVALAGCVRSRHEGGREKSQEFLRPESPNRLLEGLAAFFDCAARNT